MQNYFKEHLNEIMDLVIESFFLDEGWKGGSLDSHYLNHVLQDNQDWNYRGNICPDGRRRVLMPPMSKDEYDAEALALANARCGYINDNTPVVGFLSKDIKYAANYTGRYSSDTKLVDTAGKAILETCVKIRRHSDYSVYDSEVDDETYDKIRDFKTKGELKLSRYSEIVVYVRTTKSPEPLIFTYEMTRMFDGDVDAIIQNNHYYPTGPIAKNESLKGSPAEILLALNDFEDYNINKRGKLKMESLSIQKQKELVSLFNRYSNNYNIKLGVLEELLEHDDRLVDVLYGCEEEIYGSKSIEEFIQVLEEVVIDEMGVEEATPIVRRLKETLDNIR